MNDSFSLVGLIGQASILAKLILVLLLAASVLSWAIIASKRSLFARSREDADGFETRFWSGIAMPDLHQSLKRSDAISGMPALFVAGYEELQRQQAQPGRANAEDILAAVHRQMRITQVREVAKLEQGLSTLATIASASPYVGLFGTVWGIMTAFIAIGNVKQASLAMVAPGIAEALIATAMGLFAAIPAMIAYNFLSRGLDGLESRFHTFSEEMLGVLERSLRGQRA